MRNGRFSHFFAWAPPFSTTGPVKSLWAYTFFLWAYLLYAWARGKFTETLSPVPFFSEAFLKLAQTTDPPLLFFYVIAQAMQKADPVLKTRLLFLRFQVLLHLLEDTTKSFLQSFHSYRLSRARLNLASLTNPLGWSLLLGKERW